MQIHARQIALKALQRVHKGAFTDVALDLVLRKTDLDQRDRRFVTELVYGSIRRQRTLDALITQFARKPGQKYPVNVQLILRLGLYQLRYLSQVPDSAAVNTTVELVKANRLEGFTGFVNGLMRQYLRTRDAQPNQAVAAAVGANAATDSTEGEAIAPTAAPDPLVLPVDNDIEAMGMLHSFPNWIIEAWIHQIGVEETAQLCDWFNQTPSIDVRVNPGQASVATVQAAFEAANVECRPIEGLPFALRLLNRPGLIQALPGFNDGWWSIQDASAQLVSYLLAPQPGDYIIDACAAPGGKATHMAELMHDKGTVLACDRNRSRLKKVQQNSQRLGLTSIVTQERDCTLATFDTDPVETQDLGPAVLEGWADKILVDAPCSGLGTLHRHADARWKQTPDTAAQLVQTQVQLLDQTARWAKPGGTLVYATCTLNPQENQAVIAQFLQTHPDWSVDRADHDPILHPYCHAKGWLAVWPHRHDMDGFFMVKLRRA